MKDELILLSKLKIKDFKAIITPDNIAIFEIEFESNNGFEYAYFLVNKSVKEIEITNEPIEGYCFVLKLITE